MPKNQHYWDVLLEPDEMKKKKKKICEAPTFLQWTRCSRRFSPVPIAVTHGSDECTALDFDELILATKWTSVLLLQVTSLDDSLQWHYSTS